MYIIFKGGKRHSIILYLLILQYSYSDHDNNFVKILRDYLNHWIPRRTLLKQIIIKFFKFLNTWHDSFGINTSIHNITSVIDMNERYCRLYINETTAQLKQTKDSQRVLIYIEMLCFQALIYSIKAMFTKAVGKLQTNKHELLIMDQFEAKVFSNSNVNLNVSFLLAWVQCIKMNSFIHLSLYTCMITEIIPLIVLASTNISASSSPQSRWTRFTWKSVLWNITNFTFYMKYKVFEVNVYTKSSIYAH